MKIQSPPPQNALQALRQRTKAQAEALQGPPLEAPALVGGLAGLGLAAGGCALGSTPMMLSGLALTAASVAAEVVCRFPPAGREELEKAAEADWKLEETPLDKGHLHGRRVVAYNQAAALTGPGFQQGSGRFVEVLEELALSDGQLLQEQPANLLDKPGQRTLTLGTQSVPGTMRWLGGVDQAMVLEYRVDRGSITQFLRTDGTSTTFLSPDDYLAPRYCVHADPSGYVGLENSSQHVVWRDGEYLITGEDGREAVHIRPLVAPTATGR